MRITKEFEELKIVELIDSDAWEDIVYSFKLWDKGKIKRVYVSYKTKGSRNSRRVGWIDANTGELHVSENKMFLEMIGRFMARYMEDE